MSEFLFQSTPPARGATRRWRFDSFPRNHISIHAPREGGDWFPEKSCIFIDISIHAPREGGDFNRSSIGSSFCRFQSTPPARGATSDSDATMVDCETFQSTPPARGATAASNKNAAESLFQSTPPARGATPAEMCKFHAETISIHAPREGGDRGGYVGIGASDKAFQSTPPARGATAQDIHDGSS